MNLIFNILNIIFVRSVIYRDIEFNIWNNATHSHSVTSNIVFIFGLIFSFKISRIIYARYFAFNFFSAKLTNVHQLLPFNILNGISIILLSIPAGGIAAYIAYQDIIKTQLFISAIDALFLSLIMIIFTIWET